MATPSRTPEGWPNTCPFCGKSLVIEPSPSVRDAPCPHCGCLLWFASAFPLRAADANELARRAQIMSPPDDMDIPDSVLRLIPESVVRENLALPLWEMQGVLCVAMAAIEDTEVVEKLRFILNRQVFAVPVAREWIIRQIERYYGDLSADYWP